jgi:hypothetical protein
MGELGECQCQLKNRDNGESKPLPLSRHLWNLQFVFFGILLANS